AAAEATAQAGASLTLPILESSFAAKGLANQFKVALEQARFGREQSQQRDLLDSVLNKVNAGISIESLNAQERSTLAQFNLSSAGSESQFNLSGAELQSNREIAKSNIGLSTQDRTLALLNQLRTIRTDQARINAGLRSGGGSSGTTGSIFPGGVPRSEGIPGFTTPASRTLATAGTEARFARQATERAATTLASDKRLAEATTADTGEFTLRVPAAWAEPGPFAPSWTVWCYVENRRIAAASAYKQLQRQSDSPIEIVLKPSTDTGFEVKNVEGVPIAGARVEPMHFLVGSYDIIPERLRDLIAKETNDAGRMLFPEMGRDGFSSVQVTADGFGVQTLRLRDSAKEPAIRTITLRPAGRLEGRLVC
ncbi:hypothetical protein LCGC14_2988980, partial [marine sediment metagenome]